ncbi:hypothetical protein K469DRAFT_690764 [Zopfia rhizophila CBS 207.26]|uniref:J domain-containing protein n=1 Tax=Zopfia rhizophila CBS 207.26 TaxID=1314779 RepID=A0A6A6DST5_9PEZI|nr:hypothetical protein K469DRAFT_690764 [Zopfia rhizophila CBS 207.26]
MVGVAFSLLEDVDIFDLLGLDPSKLRHSSIERTLKEVRNAYLRVMLIAHPDKAGAKGHEVAQRLNALKEFLCGFDKCRVNPDRVIELVEKGCQGWVPRWNRRFALNNSDIRIASFERHTTKMPQRTTSIPGSSRSNPIVLDASGISAVSPEQKPQESRTIRPCGRRRTRPHLDKRTHHRSQSSSRHPAP